MDTSQYKKIWLLCLCLVLSSSFLYAKHYVVIIVGKGGIEDYTEAFNDYARQLHNALINHHNFEADQIVVLAEDKTNLPFSAIPCSSENIEKEISALAGKMKREDVVTIVLIGHGTDDGTWAKFNLPGPDLRDFDFASLLERLPAQRQIFVNTTSASAGFVEKLSRKERIVIAATRTPDEVYATIFPEYFVEAFTKTEEADLNKDNRLSVLEIFDYARDHTVRFYEQANRLRPEHPLLDDNGDGIGSETPSPRATTSRNDKTEPDGRLAANVFIEPSRVGRSSATSTSVLSANHPLEKRKQNLLAEIEKLKEQKQSMAPSEYERKIEDLFIQLARLNRRIKNQAN